MNPSRSSTAPVPRSKGGTGTSLMTLLFPMLMSGKLGRRIGRMSGWKKLLLAGAVAYITKRAQRMKQDANRSASYA